MDHHLGEVYLNGDSLYEVGKLSDVSDETLWVEPMTKMGLDINGFARLKMVLQQSMQILWVSTLMMS